MKGPERATERQPVFGFATGLVECTFPGFAHLPRKADPGTVKEAQDVPQIVSEVWTHQHISQQVLTLRKFDTFDVGRSARDTPRLYLPGLRRTEALDPFLHALTSVFDSPTRITTPPARKSK